MTSLAAAREHLARGELELAVAAFRAALLDAPGDLDAREGLGATLARLGRYAEALDELDRVLQKDATRAAAHRARSEALMRLGRFDAAVDALREAMLHEERTSKERGSPRTM